MFRLGSEAVAGVLGRAVVFYLGCQRNANYVFVFSRYVEPSFKSTVCIMSCSIEINVWYLCCVCYFRRYYLNVSTCFFSVRHNKCVKFTFVSMTCTLVVRCSPRHLSRLTRGTNKKEGVIQYINKL
jgi:hypothetical protein